MKAMPLGLCTTDLAPRPPRQLLGQIKEYGFSLVQFSFASIGEDELPAKITPNLINAIKTALVEQQLELVAINATFNLIHPDPASREEGFSRFPLLAETAARLGCPVLSLCTGTNDPTDMWRYHPANSKEESWQLLEEGLARLLPWAKRYDLTLGIEPEAANVASTAWLARRLLDKLGSDRLKIIMDCANLFAAGSAWPEKVAGVLSEAFTLLGKDIVLAHGKDIKAGPGITFTSPGQGIIDYELFLDLLGQNSYQGPMLLHGISEESQIPACRDFMKEQIAKSDYYKLPDV